MDNKIDFASQKLELAQVLFTDIVGYSRLTADGQWEVIAHLQSIVEALPGFARAVRDRLLICLPTGDGIALVCFGSALLPFEFAQGIDAALRKEPLFGLRMGLHSGPAYRRININSHPDSAGPGINFAQRVMDCGDAGHILASEEYAAILREMRSYQSLVHPLGECVVKHGVSVRIVNLHGEGFGNPEMPAKMRTKPAPARSRGNLGSMVHKMCNRRSQEDEFRNWFVAGLEEEPWPARIVVLHGEEGQCHGSLMERLAYRAERFAAARFGEENVNVASKKVPWQHEGPLTARLNRLVASLFEQCVPWNELQLRDFSPAAFALAVGGLPDALLLFVHEVRVSRWDSQSDDFLDNYLRFWQEFPASGAGPRILVFISLIYPRAEGGRLLSWLDLQARTQRGRKKHIQERLTNIARGRAELLILAELPSVTRDDVLEWFEFNNLFDSEQNRIELADRIFRSASLPMSHVEPQLKKIVDEAVGGRAA